MRINEIFDIPDEVIEEYSYGKCMWLAYLINQELGWPIMVQMDDEHIAHAYNIMPDGREIDIMGPQHHVDEFSSVVQKWSPEKMLAHLKENPNFKQNLQNAKIVFDKWIKSKI